MRNAPDRVEQEPHRSERAAKSTTASFVAGRVGTKRPGAARGGIEGEYDGVEGAYDEMGSERASAVMVVESPERARQSLRFWKLSVRCAAMNVALS